MDQLAVFRHWRLILRIIMDRPEANIERVVADLEQGSDQFLKEKLTAKTAEIKEELENQRALDFIDAICVLRHAENQGIEIKSKMREVNLLIVDNLSNEAERYIESILKVLNEYKLLAHSFNFSDRDLPDPFKVVLDRKVELPTPEQMGFLDRNLFKPYLVPGNLKRKALVEHFPQYLNVKLDLHKEAPEVRQDDREFYFIALKDDWGDQVIDGKPDEIYKKFETLGDALRGKDPNFGVTGLTLNEYLFFNYHYLIQESWDLKKAVSPMDGAYSKDNLICAENFQVSNGLVYNTGSRLTAEPSGAQIKIWQARELLNEHKPFNARFAVRIARGENGE